MSRITVPALAALIAISVTTFARGQESKTAASTSGATNDEQAVRQVTQSFVKAFNAGSAEKAAALFLSGAEFTDDAGNVHKGAAAIKVVLGRFFEKFPGATSTMTADSVWMVSPTLAIEEGQRLVSTKDDQSSAASFYTLVMSKQQGQWKIASGREVDDDDALTPHDRLKPLAWLAGDWVDEGSDAVVQISCRWSEEKNFLLVEFNAKVQGKPAMKSNQRIGWDPLTQKVRSWVFDSDGGYGEGVWSQVEDRWVIKSTAVLPDGQTGSATIVLEPQDKGSYLMKGFDRIRGKTAEPDFEVKIVRRPPAPAK
ncbi:MAG: SgcJ/EcaC family oxidoreductase [Planctomycetota bacterium]|nr:SgcJ/EcaC family oxidoreductase [Planctomycetota bacterium]